MNIDCFEEAFDALRLFAVYIGVDIEKVDSDFFGDFAHACLDFGDMTVRYSEDLEDDPEKLVNIVAHELGHAIDFVSMSEEERREFLDSTRFFNECVALGSEFPNCVRDFVMASEKIACDYSDLLVRSLGIIYGRKRARSLRNENMLGYRLLFE